MAQRKQTCRNERELGTQSKVLERLPLCTPSSSVIYSTWRDRRHTGPFESLWLSLGIGATVRRPLIEAERHDRWLVGSVVHTAVRRGGR